MPAGGKPSTFSENTLIPVGFALVLLGGAYTIGAKSTEIQKQGEALASETDTRTKEIEELRKKLDKEISEINVRLTTIQAKMYEVDGSIQMLIAVFPKRVDNKAVAK